MNSKFIAATIYLKDGVPVTSRTDMTPAGDLKELVAHFNDGGADKIYVYDLSTDDKEHDDNIHTIKDICRMSELPVCGGGNIKRFEDIKKLVYAGCLQVIVNGSKPDAIELCREGSLRFSAEKIIVSLETMDFLFKTKDEKDPIFHEYLIINPKLVQSISDVATVPYVFYTDADDIGAFASILQDENIRGIVGPKFNSLDVDFMEIKSLIMEQGIVLDNFEPAFSWDELKVNEQGLIPVIVQDYKTDQVLMLAYMNREAYYHTIRMGRMTYYSRSRQSLWVKGETSGHYQYVKSLSTDCDKDTILAKVSQVGAACHTGSYSCFFNDIMKKSYYEKNPLKVLEETYGVIMDRKVNPKEGSYTNYLFDKGLDKILKKVGEEATEIVIAAKNPNPEEIKYEISDFLYHVMVLMADKGVSWEDICSELSQR